MRRNWRRVAARTKDLQRNSRVTVDIGKLRLRQSPLSSRFARRLLRANRDDNFAEHAHIVNCSDYFVTAPNAPVMHIGIGQIGVSPY